MLLVGKPRAVARFWNTCFFQTKRSDFPGLHGQRELPSGKHILWNTYLKSESFRDFLPWNVNEMVVIISPTNLHPSEQICFSPKELEKHIIQVVSSVLRKGLHGNQKPISFFHKPANLVPAFCSVEIVQLAWLTKKQCELTRREMSSQQHLRKFLHYYLLTTKVSFLIIMRKWMNC